MEEDQNISKILEALNNVPSLVAKNEELIEMCEENNRSQQLAFKEMTETLKNAENTFSKPVQIDDKKIHITVDKIPVKHSLPLWMVEMGKEYSELKRQELSKKERIHIEIGGPRFSTFAMYALLIVLACIGIWWGVSKWCIYPRSMEAYAKRAYVAALNCDLKEPGISYQRVVEGWEDCRDSAKRQVEDLEDRARTTLQMKGILSRCFHKDIIVDDFKLKNKESIIFFHFKDDVTNYVAHSWQNGRIDYADAGLVKVETIDDANRTCKNKAWQTIREAGKN